MKGFRNHLIFPALIICGIGLVAVAQGTLDEYILSIVNFVGIYVILAVSLNITNGFAGLFSLGHPGFMAIGGYVLGLSEVLFVGLLPPIYSAYRDAFVFATLILILLILPNGILGKKMEERA